MKTDVLIIGAGIVGAALAERCAARGLRTLVLEAGVPGAGATAAGMGHLVALDGSPAELALSLEGVALWQARRAQLPAAAAYRACGTLWVARDAAEMAEAERKRAVYRDQDVACKLLDAQALYAAEPNLAPGLAGGLLMPDEAVIYPPSACAWLLDAAQRAGAGLLCQMSVARVEDGAVLLANGQRIEAARVVVAAGCQSAALLPDLPLVPRKGQLVITERYPGYVQHQLVELGYLQSAHGDGASVAFNVQPRATGQLLIGSSRQYGEADDAIDWPLLRRMLARAFDYLPGLRDLQAIRCWSGFRPSTPDKLPLLGRAPGYRRLWLATGHEGLGITTALASASLLTALMLDEAPDLDPQPYDPARFAGARVAMDALAEVTS